VNSKLECVLREATSQDVDGLIAMMRELAEQEPVLPFDPGAVRNAWMQFFGNPDFGKAWLIDVDDKTAGYVILTMGFSFEYHGREAFIDELYLAPEFRGRGIGGAAMEFVAARAGAMGVNAIHLEVDPQNDAAVGLYRRLGYVDHDRRLMTKWLKPAMKSGAKI
jgi:ribosomal protein S18 acetylase RimI-like enzyme